MIIDSNEAIDCFNRRFHNCDDAVLRRVDVIFRSGKHRPSGVNVVLSVRDSECKEARGFVNVRLAFFNVSEFSFNEGNISYQVLSEGLNIGFLDGQLFATFNPYDNPDSVEAFRKSNFYVAAKQLEWDVLPYNEYEG